MIVTCPECKTKFKLADEKITSRGVKIRCSKCSNIFVVRQDSAEAEPPPPAAASTRSQSAAQKNADFSLDDFGSKGKEFGEGDPFGDFEFGDAPLGAGQAQAAPGRPDRPQRPAAGQAPPPRPPVKPQSPDDVFGGSGIDLSRGRKMEVDVPSGGAGEFDNLDELFAPNQKKESRPATAPKAAPPPKPAPKAPPKKPAGPDPFADAPTLEADAPAARGSNDAFGDLFGDQDSDANSGLELAGEKSRGGGGGSSDEFNTLLSGTDDFFGAGPAGKEEVLDFDAKGPGGTEPTLQWGPKKNVKMESVASPVPKVLGAIVAVVLLFVGWRTSIEFVPQFYLDAGVPYESLLQLRELMPFPVQNQAFPKPKKFWEVQITKTFTIENQFGKELYVVSGRVTNKGPGKRSFFAIEAQVADAVGTPMGLPEKVFAGNELDVEALKRLPLSQIREALNVKFGMNGINFEVSPGTSLPFMVVFAGWEKKPTQVQVLGVDAVAAAS